MLCYFNIHQILMDTKYIFYIFFIPIVCFIKYITKNLSKTYSKKENENKFVLITGCDTGFGYNTALQLNQLNSKVLAGCYTKEGVRRLEQNEDFKGVALLLDVTKSEHIDNAFKLVEKHLHGKGLWCLVNNAGVLKPGPIEWLSSEDMRNTMEVNLWGTVEMTKKMLPLLKKSKGRVVNITSMAGRTLLGHGTAYSMSKYACEAFSDGLRYEMRPWGVSVHIIEPGMFATQILNTDFLIKQWKELWDTLSTEKRASYGTEFMEKSCEIQTNLVDKLANRNIEPVVDSIIHATLSPHPKRRYVVGKDANTLWILMTILPTFMGDMITNLLAKLPTPAAVKMSSS